MSTNRPRSTPPGFLATVWLLLRAARRRAVGRSWRQQQLLKNRNPKRMRNWTSLGFMLALVMMCALHAGAAFILIMAVDTGERLEAERGDHLVVSRDFIDAVEVGQRANASPRQLSDLEWAYQSEARHSAQHGGGERSAIERRLRAAVAAHGTRDLISQPQAERGFSHFPSAGAYPAMLGALVLLWWWVMVVCQGEGLELDLNRRRHPMWEWLFAHPLSAGAIFTAEMLTPIAANAVYCTAPVFIGVLYGAIYGPLLGVIAGLAIGIPVGISAAALGKALEIGIVLRFPPRSRGAMIGMMSWLGYASMMLFFVAGVSISSIAPHLGPLLHPFIALPWPWLAWTLGYHHGAFSFLSGLLVGWCVSGVVMGGAVWFAVWGAQRGLSGPSGPPAAPVRQLSGKVRFGRDPLYRKEFLWFIRDRSAIVQTILIPLTIAGFQLFNMRGVLQAAGSAWNYLCGASILLGTYFLWVLGPKSLASEGEALWIALTWPRGLESLLKAKAWLWSLIASAIVGVVLGYAALRYPADAWKVLLVGIGWFAFSRSMALKTVTLVTVTSSAGEAEKIPRGRRWAASIGMLTFSIGVLSQQWQFAIMGIVFSFLTAAAMWQNFRARLPFLFDPWSERLPPPPTLMHAMIAISILVEGGAIFTTVALVAAGRENLAAVQALAYGASAVVVSVGVWKFLHDRGVAARASWCWAEPTASGLSRVRPAWWCGDGGRGQRFLLALGGGVVGGLTLGLCAHGYLAAVSHLPGVETMMRQSQHAMESIPGLRPWTGVMAIVFAPLAEEYLFRGLLYRALDREWGGWRAVVGSASFFAILHPPLAWVPVWLLGVGNALLYRQTGRLAPAVIMHSVYNAVVLQ